MTATHPAAAHLTDRGSLAVARTVPLGMAAALTVATTAAPTGDGGLVVRPRWRRDEHGPCGRPDLAAARTTGSLRAGRRTLAVEVELAPWTHDVSEIVLRPAARAPQHWGLRRRARWFVAAHAAADGFRCQLLAPFPAATPGVAAGTPSRHAASTRQRLAS